LSAMYPNFDQDANADLTGKQKPEKGLDHE
jgi:hypothetical protein